MAMHEGELLRRLHDERERSAADVVDEALSTPVPTDLAAAVEAVLRWRRERERFRMQARVSSP
jgi:hypothetical protein